MGLQKFLKNIKLNENNISMLLGAAVIVVIGFLVVNYFRSLDNGITGTVGTNIEDSKVKLPTTYKVKAGDTLWDISEKFYQSGYNWVDIQKENNLTNASVITVGQELKIPDVAPKLLGSDNKKNDQATESALANGKTPTPTAKAQEVKPVESVPGEKYTVIHGDNLWKIAEKAYGNGFSWKKIAQANNLKDPRVIHAGNVLTIPR